MQVLRLTPTALAPPRRAVSVLPEGKQMSEISYMERLMWDKARVRLYWEVGATTQGCHFPEVGPGALEKEPFNSGATGKVSAMPMTRRQF
ncbi:hypothetical protein NPIL_58711 [Nephila pilipes]|uniref:Uncharacterized protein n=1 Tax=Nephila pilipes TaxID=299642 RepID=A0A8X6PLU3_NEPPI|nr:hypothetical protein NPIL_58711 [Nephila pilipes]